jgi:hypothetical protein
MKNADQSEGDLLELLADRFRKQLFHVRPKPTFGQGWQSYQRAPVGHTLEPSQPQ